VRITDLVRASECGAFRPGRRWKGWSFFRVKHPAMHFRLRGNDVEISGQVVEIDWGSSLVCTTSYIFFSFLFFLGSLLLYL
jgi:hypothetical protein